MEFSLKGKGAYKYIIPAILLIGFALILADVLMVYLSFTNWGPGHFVDFGFTGLDQYFQVFTGEFSSHYPLLFVWNFIFAGGTVTISFFLGVFLAIMLNKRGMKGRYVYSSLFILPWAMPAAITILAWKGLLAPSYGALNSLLGTSIPWISDPLWARFSVVMVNIWTAFPFMMFAALGSLQSIPDQVYEAAKIDGASRWRRFRHVTLPLLRSSMLPVIIFTFAFHFHNIVPILMLTGGGPVSAVGAAAPGATDTMISYAYNLAFGRAGGHYALAAAFSVFLFFILSVITAINIKITGAFEEVE